MLVTTGESIPGKKVKEIIGVVQGSTVQSKHIGRDIAASLKNLVGGELKGYTELLQDARRIAYSRMVEEAESKKADAIISMRMVTSTVGAGSSELMTYGTAVKLS